VVMTLGATGPLSAAARGTSHSSWKKLPNMAVPRWEAGSVVLDDKLYVFGGYKMPTKSCEPADAFDPRANAIQGAAGTKVKLTVYPEAGHNSWTKTYGDPDIYKSLLEHRPPGRPAPAAKGTRIRSD